MCCDTIIDFRRLFCECSVIVITPLSPLRTKHIDDASVSCASQNYVNPSFVAMLQVSGFPRGLFFFLFLIKMFTRGENDYCLSVLSLFHII